MEGALIGAFKRTFKDNFERHSSLVNLRGESGAHEAPDVALLIKGIQTPAGGIRGGEALSGAFKY